VAVTTKKASALSRSKVPKRAVVKMKAKPDGRAEAVIAPAALIPLPALSEKKVDAVVGQRNRRTIRILSCGAKGGPGKTFFCKNLAGAAAAAGYSVAVVDFDTQRTLSNWLQRRELKSADKSPIEGFSASPRSVQDARANRI
jgi:Mrp family chromosome partitioning ATPase